MSSAARFENLELSLEQHRQVDLVCLAFEDAWLAGQRPSLRQRLAEAPAGAEQVMLRELLTLELTYRRRLGESPRRAEYADLLQGLPASWLPASWLPASWQPPLGDAPSHTEAPDDAGGAGDARSPLSVGARVDRYRVHDILGAGSFGEVYLATDELLGRQVALKLPRAATASSERLLEEARMVASLRHAGIVSIYDVGRLDDGRPYIVMEHLEGHSLRQRLDQQGPAPASVAAQWIAEAAEAADYAHRRGFVHRDLTPENLLFDGGGHARIADFGLAVHELNQAHREGELAGSAPYMAPEQLRGEADALDGRCDIWALGVLLYEALVGRRPFGGAEWDELRRNILSRAPKPPRQIDPGIPPHLERACLKCLHKDPSRRFSTAADLSAALRRPASRRRWLIGAGGVGLAAAAAIWSAPRRGAAVAEPHADLKIRLDVRLWRGVWQAIDPQQTLQARAGDSLSLTAESSEPLHLHLVWIDPDGAPSPVHPWVDGEWSHFAATTASRAVRLPDPAGQWAWTLPLAPSQQGLETVVLLASAAPLDADFATRELPRRLRTLGPLEARLQQAPVWFHNGKPQSLRWGGDSAGRGAPDLRRRALVDDRLSSWHDRLHRLLQGSFVAVHAVTFRTRPATA